MDPETPTKRQKLNNTTAPSPLLGFHADNAIVLYDPSTTIGRKGPLSMEELIKSPFVALTIGSEESTYNLPTNLFRGISEPLNRLLANAASGHDPDTIKECLRHDDKDAFMQLISMSYSIVQKGAYVSATDSKSIVKSEHDDQNLDVLLDCPHCKKDTVFISTHCDDDACDNADGNCKDNCVDVGLKCFFELQLTQSHGTISKQAKAVDTKQVLPRDNAAGEPYPLIHFAKVFNLASKYEVPTLQLGALKAFERRLKKYSNTPSAKKSMEELLDVLKYLASSSTLGSSRRVVDFTAEEGQVTTTTLLKSLMKYVVVHVSDLLDEEEFREIVVEHGTIGLELMKVLDESMRASLGR